jgi:hypothetical protein
MRRTAPSSISQKITIRHSAAVVAIALALSSLVYGSYSAEAAPQNRGVAHEVAVPGFRVQVPAGWRVVNLTSKPHACIRFDHPAAYVGASGDQPRCPAHLIGGAPGLQVEPLTATAVNGVAEPLLTAPASGDVGAVQLPPTGPVAVAIPGAGVLVTLTYGPNDAALMRTILAGSQTSRGHRRQGVPAGAQAAPAEGVGVPGDYTGKGFDTCTAPSQAVMDAWRASSGYASVGIYIGGVDMGCSQPNLTAAWVSRQVSNGWHLLPVYVGHQAPCSGFANRISYDVPTARAQGEADASDAMARADMRGITAPSTLYSDVEGYDSSNARCVASVMSYVSGWTFELHTGAYQGGVYSSAASGMHDLSTHYNNLGAGRPDDLFIAWWNHRADVNGGSFVPNSQWSNHQRVHQYEGQQVERHSGYTMNIDRNFLDVSSVVEEPAGCPANLDFLVYPFLRWPTSGNRVRAVQCLLALRGFDPGAATGVLNWRTAPAIRAFKASRGLGSSTSSVGKYAWAALLSAGSTAPVHRGSARPWVRKLQRTLTARLQKAVAINGVFGTSTRAAVLRYQKTVGLKVTGTVYAPTWRALRSGR